MRVLFVSRNNLFENEGGDSIQILNTKKELENYGVEVEIATNTMHKDLESFDIIHFFNLTRPLEILPYLNSSAKKILSPIYVDYSEYERKHSSHLRKFLIQFLGTSQFEWLKLVARDIKENKRIQKDHFRLLPFRKKLTQILNTMDMLLPNSNSEFERLQKDFPKLNTPFLKVPNGIEIKNVNPNEKYKDSVVCSGRVEGLKNQLSLIKALNKLPYSAFIIGSPSTHHLDYYEKCKEVAKDHIHFIDRVSQKELFEIFKAARVHVLPSFFETTGLVSLEAAYYGCNIVISDKGDQREYFDNYATICDPDNVVSIKNAVQLAFESPHNVELKNRIEQEFTWKKAAEKTYEAYQKVVGN